LGLLGLVSPHDSECRLQKYDFLSAAAGSTVVTAYCVHCGQNPLQALSLTVAATVLALVANEVLFDD